MKNLEKREKERDRACFRVFPDGEMCLADSLVNELFNYLVLKGCAALFGNDLGC